LVTKSKLAPAKGCLLSGTSPAAPTAEHAQLAHGDEPDASRREADEAADPEADPRVRGRDDPADERTADRPGAEKRRRQPLLLLARDVPFDGLLVVYLDAFDAPLRAVPRA
jgi:hypothetical protein